MKLTVLSLTVLATAALPTFAGQEMKEVVDKNVVVTTPFDKGRWEYQSNIGAYFSLRSGGESRPDLHYIGSNYRLGIMLYDPAGSGFFRGNTEFMVQLFTGSIFDGPGDYLIGGALVLRYNFVQPDAKWVPYIQIGAGGAYNDIHTDTTQRLIGQPWEWDLEAAIGLRYMLSDKWSLSLEAGYRHISNADSADRNVGLNSIGGLVGLGYHF